MAYACACFRHPSRVSGSCKVRPRPDFAADLRSPCRRQVSGVMAIRTSWFWHMQRPKRVDSHFMHSLFNTMAPPAATMITAVDKYKCLSRLLSR